jgi:hypothetical protein
MQRRSGGRIAVGSTDKVTAIQASLSLRFNGSENQSQVAESIGRKSAIPDGDPSSPRLVVPASELFLLKRLACLHRGPIEVKHLVIGAGPDPGTGRRVAVAAEGDAAAVESDRQAFGNLSIVIPPPSQSTTQFAVFSPRQSPPVASARLLPRRFSEKAKL